MAPWTKVEKHCTFCGESLIVGMSFLKSKDLPFCNDDCMNGWMQDQSQLACYFCHSNTRYLGTSFCSKWCIGQYHLNGNRPATKCGCCGWTGASQDFYPSPHGVVCYSCLTEDHISDDEFETYRIEILKGMS